MKNVHGVGGIPKGFVKTLFEVEKAIWVEGDIEDDDQKQRAVNLIIDGRDSRIGNEEVGRYRISDPLNRSIKKGAASFGMKSPSVGS